jgi:septal ring factor EnvC (AmiA/AmiB activator)
MNRFQWDLRYPDATRLERPSPMWSGSTIGPRAVPGNYVVKLFIGDSLMCQQPFVIKEDPRYGVTQKDLDEQLALLLKINKKLSETHEAINDLRSIRSQMNTYIGSVEDTAFASQLKNLSKPILDSLQRIEDALVQHHAVAGQDLLNYPIKLNDKLAGIGSAVASTDSAPTKQSYVAFDDISALIDEQLFKLEKIKEEKIPAFNQVAKQKSVDPIKIK